MTAESILPGPVRTGSGDRWVVAVRLLWPVLAALSLGSFAVLLIVGYSNLVDVSPQTRSALAGAGLSAQADALIRLGLDVAFVAVFAGVAGLIYLRRPNDRMALLTAVALVIWGPHNGSVVGGDYLPAVATGLDKAMAGLLGLFAYLSWVLFFYLFPSGRFVPAWTRYLAIAWALTAVTWNSPIGMPGWPLLPQAAAMAVLWGSFPVAQIYRYWRVSTPLQRLQTKWVVLGVAAGVIGFRLVSALFPELVATGDPRLLLAESGLQHLFLAMIPVSIGIAILRNRLFDIDVILSRTLVYGALTAMVVGSYVLIVGGIGALMEARQPLLLSLLATGLIAIAFQPARLRLQRAANRLVYGYRDEPYTAISRLGRRLDAPLSSEAVLLVVADSIKEALKLPHAGLAIEGAGSNVISVGEPTGALLKIPLVFAGESVGALLLSSRAPSGTWTAAERELLQDLARVAAVVAQSVRLNRALQRSRERLVLAREEELRRLRRDLHDELGPALAALALRASRAADLIPEDASRARAMIRVVEQTLRTSVGSVRQLARNLRPPTLDELGLVAAIRERAEQLAAADSRLRVQVDAPEGMPQLSAACEVAAYRIAQEALLNVVRHAGARRCIVRFAISLRDGETGLELSVEDDGVGLKPMRHRGVGLLSMQERAAELGGTCEIEAGPGGGTRVHGWIPSVTVIEEGDSGIAARPDR